MAGGFDPGVVDGRFGSGTRVALREWQAAQGVTATGYLDAATAAALRAAAVEAAQVEAERQADIAAEAERQAAAQRQAEIAAEAERQAAAQRQAEIAAEAERQAAAQRQAEIAAEAERQAAAQRQAEITAEAARQAAAQRQAEAARQAEAQRQAAAQRQAELRRPGRVFRDCPSCPEMVVLSGGGLAMGRYEVTVGEYRAFASATGGGGDDCSGADSWRDPGYAQTDRHPVTCVSWDDAQEYVSWLSRTTGTTYRLPTEAEWESAAAGSERGCDRERTGNRGTCRVGSHGPNAAGLSDMVGNLWEWTEDCWEGNCGRRVLRGGSWSSLPGVLRAADRVRLDAGFRYGDVGFRVARTLGAP